PASGDASAASTVDVPALGHNGAPRGGQSPPTGLEKWLLCAVLEACGSPAVRLVLGDGEAICLSRKKPVGDIIVHDRGTLRRLALNPNVAFGDGYAEGRIDVKGDLVEVLCEMSQAQHQSRPNGLLGKILTRQRRSTRAHTISASRESVHHHYDIGNEFY